MTPNLSYIMAFLMILFSSVVFAEDDVPCGMMFKDGGYVVEPRNGDICPEDIAFQGTYLMYSDILQDAALRDLVLLFVSKETLDSPFTEFADETISISSGLYFILSAVAIFSWSLLLPIISIKGYKYAIMVKKTGEISFSENKGDTLKFISYTSFMFFLILPTGFSGGQEGDKSPLMIGQSLAVIGSLPAHMGGNYIYSTYLHSTDVAASDIELNEELLLPMGQNISNGIIEGQLCQKRTRQALFSTNAKVGSKFFDTAGFNEMIFGIKQEGILERVDSCLGYVATADRGGSNVTINNITINKTGSSSSFCSKYKLLTAISPLAIFGSQSFYDEEVYGYNHTCSSVDYGISDGKFDITWEGVEVIGGVEKDVDEIVGDVQSSYTTNKFFNAFKEKVRTKISQILMQSDTAPDDKMADLNELFIESGKELFATDFNDEPLLKSGNNDQKQLKHMAIATSLLGGTIEIDTIDALVDGNLTGGSILLIPAIISPAISLIEDFFSGDDFSYSPMKDFEEVQDGGLNNLLKYSREYTGLTSGGTGDVVFGYDVLANEANEIADLIIEYQCAIEWSENTDTRIFIAKMNETDDDDDIGNYINKSDTKYSCVEFLAPDDRVDTDFRRWIGYPTKDNKVFDDIDNSSGSWTPKNLEKEEFIALKRYFEEDLASKLFMEIRARQLVLTGYTVAVKTAVADSLSNSLSLTENEAEFDVDLRPKGWGIMGGALLYLGQTQGSALHMKKSLSNAISVEVGATDTSYISMEAFGKNANPDLNRALNILFPPMAVDELFTTGSSGVNGYAGQNPITEKEKGVMDLNRFLVQLDKTIMSPSVHIKSASGMDTNKTLQEGFRTCFNSGYDQCLSGNKHPVVALSHFGNDMMDNMLTIIMVDAVLRVVDSAIGFTNNAISAEAGSIEDASKKKGFLKKLWGGLGKLFNGTVGLLLKIVGAITTTAVVIMDVLMPLVYGLFMAGAVFAFIIPMMSFLYGFMMLLLTYVGIFLTAVVFPLYAITKFLHIEQEYQQGFKKFYEDMLGPYLTPLFFTVSAVLAWNLIVIVLYVLNASFTLIYQGLGASGASSGLTGIFFKVFMYIVYLVAVFILFRFSLGIMKDMPDMLKEKLKLKRGNDDKFIQSLGFEQYVNTQAMADIAKMPSGLSRGLSEHAKRGGFSSDKELKAKSDLSSAHADVINGAGGPQAYAEKLQLGTQAYNEMRGKDNGNMNQKQDNSEQHKQDAPHRDGGVENTGSPIEKDVGSSDSPKTTIEKDSNDGLGEGDQGQSENLQGDVFKSDGLSSNGKDSSGASKDNV